MECRVCGNHTGNTPYEVAEMMYGTGDVFSYFQCADCDCLQIAAYPDDIARHYGANYYSYSQGLERRSFLQRIASNLRDRHTIGDRGPLVRFFEDSHPHPLLANLAPLLRDRKLRILDVGCGSAALLRSLDRIGFHDVSGADPYIDEELSFGQRGRVFKKALAQMDGAYDLIFMMHSLEHMPQQHAIFGQLADRLAQNGTAVIAVPLASSYAWEHYGVDWVQLDAPRHFYLHSVGSMERLAVAASLRITNVIYDSTPFQFWGSEQYRRGIPLRDAESLAQRSIDGSMFTRDQMAEFRRRSAELNASARGDQALFFIQKSATAAP